MPTPVQPWIKVETRLVTHRKIADLSSDSARWGWMVVLCRAKTLRPQGQFASLGQLREEAGRFARFVPEWRRAGLLDEPNGDGMIHVHDWNHHQFDPTHAARQAAYRDAKSDGDGDGGSDAKSDGPRDSISDGGSDAVRARAIKTADSDTRQKTVRRSSTRESPARIPRDAIVLDGSDRPDLQALAARGMHYIRPAELAILDHIADNERAGEWKPIATGQEVIAGWIREAPKGGHLVDHVIRVENQLKLDRGMAADEIEAEWRAFKEADLEAHPRNGAGPVPLSDLLASLRPEPSR